MIVELHMLQNFAPSCLNRDDTNAPKDCEFGGYRRARISSQCIKRAVRDFFREEHAIDDDHLGLRTKYLVGQICERLVAMGREEATARLVIAAAIKAMGLDLDEKKKEEAKTKVLLFLDRKEIERLASLCDNYWDYLAALTSATDGQQSDKTLDSTPQPPEDKKPASRRQKKKEAKEAVPKKFTDEAKAILDGGRSVDIALFGRMIADLPEANKDAACQVAHAISTHRVAMEFDFYTAVDDLKAEDTTGAEMMGTMEFNSACFYRYANIDMEQLKTNLKDDEELAKSAVEAFLRAAIEAIPTGKQNSMAAHNPPSLIMGVVRERGLWNLANAFVDPVRADGKGHLVQKSISALEDYWTRLEKAYGREQIRAIKVLTLDGKLTTLEGKDYKVDNCYDFLNTIIEAIDLEKSGTPEGG